MLRWDVLGEETVEGRKPWRWCIVSLPWFNQTSPKQWDSLKLLAFPLQKCQHHEENRKGWRAAMLQKELQQWLQNTSRRWKRERTGMQNKVYSSVSIYCWILIIVVQPKKSPNSKVNGSSHQICIAVCTNVKEKNSKNPRLKFYKVGLIYIHISSSNVYYVHTCALCVCVNIMSYIISQNTQTVMW